MDLWVAIAAGAAGYIAKQWQNPPRERQSSSDMLFDDLKCMKPESPRVMGQLHDKFSQFSGLAQRRHEDENISIEEEQNVEGAYTSEVTVSTPYHSEQLMKKNRYEDCNMLSITSLWPGYLRDIDMQGDSEALRVSDNADKSSGNSLAEPSKRHMGMSGLSKGRNSLRSGRSNLHFIKPKSSLESCLMAQLYKENIGIEDYVLSLAPSPSTTVKPLLVTDGRRIISRASSNSFGRNIGVLVHKFHKQTCSTEDETVFELSPLPNVGSLKLPRKMKVKTAKEQHQTLSRTNEVVSTEGSNTPAGSSQAAFIFSLGVSLGLTSSFLVNRREVDKLNDLLKQTENLVQDLQEELELKDSLTVKELAIEDHDSQDAYDCSYSARAQVTVSTKKNLNGAPNCDGNGLHELKAEEHSEAMTKIEAELRAELEQLELNMSSSSLEGKLSDLVEDQDLILGMALGELRPEVFGRQADSQPYADRDGSGVSTPHSANYAVSPRELSLRLHQVIQSRLEERIKELETALESVERKVQSMQTEHVISWGESSSDGELRSFSYLGSPVVKEQQNVIDQAIVINLSGDALDAYNQAYDEFMRMKEDTSPSSRDEKLHQKAINQLDQDVSWDQNGWVNHDMPHCSITHESPDICCTPEDENLLEEQKFDMDISGDQSDDSPGEKLLIKQIVEKARKGSAALLNAQKALYSMDENEK